MRRILLAAKLALFSTGVSLFMGAACFAQSAVTSIRVESSWVGLGKPVSSKQEIKLKQGHFFIGSKQLPDGDVQAFLGAVERARRGQTGLNALGITEDWLKANAETALREYLEDRGLDKPSPKQADLFLRSFSNYKLVSGLLSNQGTWVKLDDEPEIIVRLRKPNGAVLTIRSVGNLDFLSDWSVSNSTESYETTSGAISLSLWRLLPVKFTNRERLSEAALRETAAKLVITGVNVQWDALGAEAKLGLAIGPVTQRFTLLSSAVSSLLSIDLNGGESWNALVRDSTLPSNVSISLSLPFRNKKLVGVDTFLRRIDDCVRLALFPTWLSEFLSKHPDAMLEIRFVEDRSLSHYAEGRFTEEMQRLGKPEIAQHVSRLSADVVFVELKYGTWSRWIVLPGGDMVLWEFQGEKVGNWSDKDFSSSDCHGWKCVGTVISSSGKPN
jgi:hypothetical protein